MAVEGITLVKGLGTICFVAGTGCVAYYGYKKFSSDTTGENTSKPQKEASKLSKYDEALINFLDKDGQDIIFEVKKGAGFTENLSNTDLNTLNNPLKIKAQIKVTSDMKVNTSAGNNTFKFTAASDAANGPLKEIKDLNGGAWTWSCSFELKKEEGVDKKTIKEEIKKRVMGDTDKGLFGILKKDATTYAEESANGSKWTKAGLKAEKKKFIRLCAEMRMDKIKNINEVTSLDDNALDVEIPAFDLYAKTGQDNLEPKKEADFNKWFDPTYGTREYHTVATEH